MGVRLKMALKDWESRAYGNWNAGWRNKKSMLLIYIDYAFNGFILRDIAGHVIESKKFDSFAKANKFAKSYMKTH